MRKYRKKPSLGEGGLPDRARRERSMIFKYNGKLKPLSQELRKNMTKEERHLWYDFLKSLPITVKRQKIIGDYIVDFYCETNAVKLVIELDGSQHYEEENARRDKERDGFLQSLGITVLRYGNREVNERFEFVCADIYKHLQI